MFGVKDYNCFGLMGGFLCFFFGAPFDIIQYQYLLCSGGFGAHVLEVNVNVKS